jgi:hypothetical protein
MTRTSVCQADDSNAPHAVKLMIPDDFQLEDIPHAVRSYLPLIYGGEATWSILLFDIPIAVIAQQWEFAKTFQSLEFIQRKVGSFENGLRVQAVYHAQHNPDIVYDVLLQTAGY